MGPWDPAPPAPEAPALQGHATADVAIVGAGYIAVEFAGIFHGLGAKVDIVLRRDRVLRGFDEECRTFVHEALKDSGIRMRTVMEIARIVAGTGKAQIKALFDAALAAAG